MKHEITLTKTRFIDGVWEGRIDAARGGAAPDIEVLHLDIPLPGVTITEEAEAGSWTLRVPIPADRIGDGVHTFQIRDKAGDALLGVIPLMAGDAVPDDVRVEINLLRAELDMLKRAFRRHCVETM